MTVTPNQAEAIVARIDCLAADVGRIRKRLAGDEYGLHLVDRVSGHVAVVDSMLQPSAGELVHAEISARDAIDYVDSREDQLRGLTGEPKRWLP